MLKHHIIQLIHHKKDILKGRYCFQHKDITWSYLNLGNDVLTQTKTKHIIVPFKQIVVIEIK